MCIQKKKTRGKLKEFMLASSMMYKMDWHFSLFSISVVLNIHYFNLHL